MVRLPSLFPFKRQEDEAKEPLPKGRTGNIRRRKPKWRRNKDDDRQRITINGKHYYVDDDGELKEMEAEKEEPRVT